MYFVGAVMRCSRGRSSSGWIRTLRIMRRSRGLYESILMEVAFVGVFCLCWLGLTAVSLSLTAVSLLLTGVQM